MSEVIGVVDIVAAEGRADEVVAAFEACMTATHQEEGCLTYALHRDDANPNHFVHVERWRSQADLDDHMTKPYVAELFAVAGTPGVLAQPPAMTFGTSLGLGDPAKGSL
jgi:quinol monooxygenase YgiN